MPRNLFYSAGCLFRLGWATLLFVVVLALVKHFVVDVMPVSGISMVPTFLDRDVIVLNKISYFFREPQRGDNVVLRFPGDPDHERYIKRIIGLPGETVVIREGKVSINGVTLDEPYLAAADITYPALEKKLDTDEYYLIGDNRPASSDSRIWGPAERNDFIGKTFAIVYPFNRAKLTR
jgi:signal peptidase I